MLQFPAWKVALILMTLAIGTLFALPNALNERQRNLIPGFMPSSQVNLGLDLRGGVYLLLNVDPEQSITKQLNDLAREARRELNSLRGAERISYVEMRVEGQTVRFRPRDPDQIDAAMRIMRTLNEPVGGPVGPAGLEVRRVGGEVEMEFTTAKKEEIRRDALRQTVSKLGPRLDPDGVGEISVQPQGEDRIIVEAPGVQDPQRLKDIIQKPGVLTLNLVDSDSARVSEALRTGRTRAGFDLVYDLEGTPYLIESDPIIEGDMVRSAAQGLDERGRPGVNFTFNQRGARLFGEATARNIGRQFAIILDGQVRSAPVIQTAIRGGSGIIEGRFTYDEARDLATIIQAGALPAKITVEDERQVGPTLGADSIRAGAVASVIGLILVAIFMIIAYGLFGGFAVTTLAFNIIIILGALSGLGATLTLPGIAGIILTIGMAVDANVLVFERIREEARNGRSPLTAVDVGYQQATSTILDANITTLLAAAVLYTLGSGPVKGFAVTLAIGIFTSVFTAFVVTRWLTVLWLRGTRPKTLPI